MKEQNFVDFFSPGTLFAEVDTRKIDSWDVEKAIEMSKSIIQRYGARPYAFQFFTKARSDDDLDSREVKRSGTYFINGTVKSLEELEAENDPNNRILISNMRCNKWDKIVQTRSLYNWTQPFKDGDQVIKVEENK